MMPRRVGLWPLRRRRTGGAPVAHAGRAPLLCLALLAGLTACGGDDDGGAGEEAGAATTSTTASPETSEASEEGGDAGVPGEVEIVDFTFTPEEITVPVGTTVTWRNADEAIHSVADRSLGIESEDLAQGGSFEHTYEEAGTFPYVCGIHNYMEGTVIVE